MSDRMQLPDIENDLMLDENGDLLPPEFLPGTPDDLKALLMEDYERRQREHKAWKEGERKRAKKSTE